MGDGTDSAQSGKGTPGEPVFFSGAALAGMPWMVLGKSVLFLLYFGISIVAVRALGKEQYGVYTLCQNIAEYLVVFCALGLNAALLRFIPELRVQKNRAGLIRMLWKAGLLQAATCAVAAVLIVGGRSQLHDWFNIDFGAALLWTVLLAFAMLGKNFTNDALTAFFRVPAVTILSLIQGVLWFGGFMLLLMRSPSATHALGVQGLIFLAGFVAGLVLLVREVRNLRWRSPPFGIGKRRILRLSGATLLNNLAQRLMHKYTEVFFLGIFAASPAIVGIYDLGYSVPLMVILLIPGAVQSLLTSAFAEAYTRDPNCLGRLIASVYRMLILVAAPISAFGVFFVSRGIVLIYGEEMAAAGPVAATFCVLHVLGLISMPLSMAIAVRERVLRMLPLLIVQVGVNLALDLLLIPPYGMVGGILAVLLTFALTIPLRLYVVRKILGGIFFPTSFFLRIYFPFLCLAALMSPLSAHLSLPVYLFVGAFYVVLCLVMVRGFGLIRDEDVADFRVLNNPRVDKLLNLLTGAK